VTAAVAAAVVNFLNLVSVASDEHVTSTCMYT